MNKNNKIEYYKKCIDCGRFVAKKYWLKKSKYENRRPLCNKCSLNYDDPNFF